MNDETKRGFQLFAQHRSALLCGMRQTSQWQLNGAWNAMSPFERDKWKQRAQEGMVKAPTSPGKKPKRGKKGASCKLMDFRPLDEGGDMEDEDDMGVPVEQLVEEQREKVLQQKYEEDRRMVEEAIMAQTGGSGEKIKRLRFLLASVQTFGDVDGVCMMAEFAMNELNLYDGVVDRVSSLVGPWTIDNDIKRSRAVFHSNETHRIPLQMSSGNLNKRELLTEILGRTEPAIAVEQGIRVGLYREDQEDEEQRLNRVFSGQKNMYHIVDKSSRRFVICLRQEYHYMLASMRHLKESVGLVYDGFPCTPDRFVLADAFVDAVAACLDGRAIGDTAKWLSALGTPLPQAVTTPWERGGELDATPSPREELVLCHCDRLSRLLHHPLRSGGHPQASLEDILPALTDEIKF